MPNQTQERVWNSMFPDQQAMPFMMLIGSQAVEKIDLVKRTRIGTKVELVKLLAELEALTPKIPTEDLEALRTEIRAYGGPVTIPGVGVF